LERYFNAYMSSIDMIDDEIWSPKMKADQEIIRVTSDDGTILGAFAYTRDTQIATVPSIQVAMQGDELWLPWPTEPQNSTRSMTIFIKGRPVFVDEFQKVLRFVVRRHYKNVKGGGSIARSYTLGIEDVTSESS